MTETPRARNAADALHDIAVAQRMTAAANEMTARPWYFLIPQVALACVTWFLMPFTIVVKVAETILAGVVLVVVGTIGLWYTGGISDADVVNALLPVGRRILEMATSLTS